MKIKLSLPLFALGIALAVPSSWAQTTPTGAATSTTYPQGAITTDSTTGKMTRQQKRAMKRTNRTTNQNSNNSGTTNTSSQDARYRQSSSSNGTAVNNSNSTNYNSNNATNAPTGVGSNPNTSGNASSGNATASPTPTNPGSSGQNTGMTTTPDSNAGSAAAVSGAKSSETPAVKAGSTARNTSIGDFVASSPNYTTLQNALQSADLWETLKGGGPFTVFAPANSAFKKLPTSAQGALLEGSNRAALKQLLSYHVVSGSVSADALAQQIKAGNGKAKLTTLSGATLTASESNGRITLTDEQGGTATVDAPDNRQMNGVVHGISGVLMPKSGMEAFR